MKKLSHINNKGEANMVDIQDKKSSKRVAIAEGSITLSKKALNQINDDKVSKGNVINTARIAGIMGAKKTSDLIPLCHPIPIEAIKIDFSINEKDINVLATVSTTNKTGVEMEALVAVNIACLTIYDMVKSVDKKAKINENFSIKHGAITTIHDVTNTQVPVDFYKSDLRRARGCLQSLIPTTTGSAKAIAEIFPELEGKLNGHAVRVPLLNASLTDAVFELNKQVTEEQVNNEFKKASETYLKGILGYEERPLVSADYLNDCRSSIIDGLSTMVVNSNLLKVYAWYDNEWGYSCRLADLTSYVIEKENKF